MRLRVQLTSIDMVHVAGEVLGLAIFQAGAEEVDTGWALDRFIMALNGAAWELRVAGSFSY